MRHASTTPVSALLIVLFSLTAAPSRSSRADQPLEVDVLIYGGTSAGIAAAVQAKRMGKTVVVLEPTKRIGGLTTGGLGQTDIGNKAAIGGISLEFYQAIAAHYQQEAAWRWQPRDSYRSGGQSKTAEGETAMWTFEPSAALAVYEAWVRRDSINIHYEQQLDRSNVALTTSRPAQILQIQTMSGERYRAKMFIDASYEGDLMAAAKVSYTVGRESNSLYGETLNGVQTKRAHAHQLVRGVDPFVIPGDAGSGLLPHIDPEGPGIEGEGDHRVQAYCFRMCLTDHPDNRIAFHKPDGYQPLWYELMLRNFEAGETAIPWANSGMPNRKTDTNNNKGFSTDFIGQNADYPGASYEQRQRIVEQHRLYQQGLMWTLANHPRVPAAIRDEVSRWGVCKDEFTAGNGWQEQLYIREARRMVGQYVMTQLNCQGLAVDDPVGLAAYTMDSHNQQRYVDDDGHVRNEGDVQVGGFSPYGISYRSIVPKQQEVSNLLVPVCLSASHIAFGSIRMEPVFMVLGQSAATAAAIAIDDSVAVQAVSYSKLADQLQADHQVLQYRGPAKPQGLDPKKLPGLIVDNSQVIKTGNWTVSSSSMPRVGEDYLHDNDDDKGKSVATYQVTLPSAGRYRVSLYWPPYSNRATNTPVTVYHLAGEKTVVRIDQRDPTSHGRATIGEFEFSDSARIEISNQGTDGHVIVDAVQFEPLSISKDR